MGREPASHIIGLAAQMPIRGGRLCSNVERQLSSRLCHRYLWKDSDGSEEHFPWRIEAVRVESPTLAEIVRQVVRSDTVKAFNPLVQPAVIGIDVLNMEGTFDARAGGQIDRFMADARFLGKVVVTGVGVADEQRIRVEHRRQAFTQLRFADRPFPARA